MGRCGVAPVVPQTAKRVRGRSMIRAGVLFRAVGVFAVWTTTGCSLSAGPRPWWSDGERYMVAADHAAASRAGADILAAGGNAVDAAVATAFALAVVRPESCGLGGGGFMVIRAPGASPVAIDFRESAPAGAARRYYLDDGGKPIPDKTRRGAWAVGVPGQVKGLLLALERYGSGRLTRRMILAPAIRLARAPLTVDRHLHDSMVVLAEDLRRSSADRERFDALARMFLRNGEPRPVGDAVHLTALATTLEAIAARGNDGFYAGPVGQRLVSEVQRRGGPLTWEDLQDYEARVVPPLEAWVGRHYVITMPPPSSGGAVLLEVLNVMTSTAQVGPSLAGTATPLGAHFFVEAMKHAFADRATLLGDRTPEVLAAVEDMIAFKRSRRLRRAIRGDRTQPITAYGLTAVPEDSGTSHFCVVDARGGAVSCTSTINLGFGSYILVPDTGVILNDEMDDFAVDATTPNAFGLRQSEQNLIEPGRRPLSSMSPTIVLRDGRVELVLGASGGPRIISATLQTMLNVLASEMTIDRAVAAPRLHHQWLPDVVYAESGIDDAVIRGLLDRGHTVRRYSGSAGHVQAIARMSHGWRGVCDPDKGGRPAGR